MNCGVVPERVIDTHDGAVQKFLVRLSIHIRARPAPDGIGRVGHAFARDALQVGIMLQHPNRRTARTRAQQNLQAVLRAQLEEAVEPRQAFSPAVAPVSVAVTLFWISFLVSASKRCRSNSRASVVTVGLEHLWVLREN